MGKEHIMTARDNNSSVKIKLSESIDTVPIRVLGRTHLACVRCRNQKTKCDGTKPSCKTCIAAGKNCEYQFKDRKIILLESQVFKLQDRIKYLETSLKNVTDSTNNNLKVIDASTLPPASINSAEEQLQEPLQPQQPQETNTNTGIDGSQRRSSYLHQQYPLIPNPLFEDPENFNNQFYRPSTQDKLEKNIDKIHVDPKPLEEIELCDRKLLKFDYALQDCLGDFSYFDSLNPNVQNMHGNAKHYLSDNFFDYPHNGYVIVPEKEYCLKLFDIVYNRLCHTYYLFDREEFLKSIDKLYEELNAQTSMFLCKLLITMAIGEQLVFSKLSFDPDFITNFGHRINHGIAGLKFFTLAIQLFRYNHENLDIENIQTCALIAYYEQLLNRTTSAHAFYGLAMRLVVAKGFHRQYTYDSGIENEKRKRVWWTIYTMMAMCAARLHLPTEIEYEDTDVDLPLENYLDLGDNFKSTHLQAHIMITRYVNPVIKKIYCASSRSFKRSFKPVEPSAMMIETLNHTLYFMGEFDRIRQEELYPIFARVEAFISGAAPFDDSDTRDDQNVLLTYYSIMILTARPVVLSFLRGMMTSSQDILAKLAQRLIHASFQILLILKSLKENNLLHTFDYWDCQYCFTAMIILIVAGVSHTSSTLVSTGAELMAFMANSGNHPARSYFAKLVTLDDCLIASGASPVYGRPLSSLIRYETLPEDAETPAVHGDKVDVRTQEFEAGKKQEENSFKRRNISENPIKPEEPAFEQQYSDYLQKPEDFITNRKYLNDFLMNFQSLGTSYETGFNNQPVTNDVSAVATSAVNPAAVPHQLLMTTGSADSAAPGSGRMKDVPPVSSTASSTTSIGTTDPQNQIFSKSNPPIAPYGTQPYTGSNRSALTESCEQFQDMNKPQNDSQINTFPHELQNMDTNPYYNQFDN